MWKWKNFATFQQRFISEVSAAGDSMLYFSIVIKSFRRWMQHSVGAKASICEGVQQNPVSTFSVFFLSLSLFLSLLFRCRSFGIFGQQSFNWTVMDSFKIKIVLWTVGLWIAVVLAQEPSILTAQGEIRGVSFWVICGSSLNQHF